jgi:uncharacterized Tic20 family protein
MDKIKNSDNFLMKRAILSVSRFFVALLLVIAGCIFIEDETTLLLYIGVIALIYVGMLVFECVYYVCRTKKDDKQE